MRYFQASRFIIPIWVVAALGIAFSEPMLRRIQTPAREALRVPASPPPSLEYATFGHKRGVAALLWLQVLTWYGANALRDKAFVQMPAAYEYIDEVSRTLIRLDHDFPDVYSFAAMSLMWFADQPLKAMPFTAAGMAKFPKDWTYTFYHGFIYYRFLHDRKTAAQFFIRAGQIEGSPPFVPLLGAKLLREETGTGDAVESLQAMLSQELPAYVEKFIQAEIDTLLAIEKVEVAVDRFKSQTGRTPSLDELVETGFLSEVPLDPSGEPLVIEDGKVTSVTGGLH